MLNTKNRKRVIWGVVLMLMMAIGVTAAFAQSADDPDAPEVEEPADADTLTPALPFGRDDWNGRPDFNGSLRDNRGNANEALADALGVTVEELEAAQTAAREAALAANVEQAVADGLITQEQADEILSGDFSGLRGQRGFMPRGFNTNVDYETLLADELGISVEELQAAQETVRAAQLEQAIEDGLITQEQADMMAARKAVNEYMDFEALQETMQAAFEDAVAQALADGVITQEQADEILTGAAGFGFGERGSFGGPGKSGGHSGPGGRGHGGHGFPGVMPGANSTTTTADSNA